MSCKVAVIQVRAYYVGRGEGGKLPPFGARGNSPLPNRPCTEFFRRKSALTLLCRTRYVLLYIKTPIWNSKFVFLSILSENNA